MHVRWKLDVQQLRWETNSHLTLLQRTWSMDTGIADAAKCLAICSQSRTSQSWSRNLLICIGCKSKPNPGNASQELEGTESESECFQKFGSVAFHVSRVTDRGLVLATVVAGISLIFPCGTADSAVVLVRSCFLVSKHKQVTYTHDHDFA